MGHPAGTARPAGQRRRTAARVGQGEFKFVQRFKFLRAESFGRLQAQATARQVLDRHHHRIFLVTLPGGGWP